MNRDPANPYPPPPWAKVVSITADQATDAAEREPGIMAPWMPWHFAEQDLRQWVRPNQRTVFATVALDDSEVWAIGDTADEARAATIDRREYLRDCARSVGEPFPPPSTDAAWLDKFALVAMTGTTKGLRAIVAALDDVIPWCPRDLWDYQEEVTP